MGFSYKLNVKNSAYVIVYIDTASQSIEQNNSVINWIVKYYTPTARVFSSDFFIELLIDNKKVGNYSTNITGSVSPNGLVGANAEITLYSGTMNINHLTDGTKELTSSI